MCVCASEDKLYRLLLLSGFTATYPELFFLFDFVFISFYSRVFLVHSLCKIVLFGTYCKKTFIFVSFL